MGSFTCKMSDEKRKINKFSLLLMCRQGLNNGEAVVIYKHPDDSRIFGQYTFKDERCLYETVYYYVNQGKYEFTSEFIFSRKEG